MKRFFTYLFFCCMLVYTTGSVWVLTIFQARQEYIAKELCINRFDLMPVCAGSCVLMETLDESSTKEALSGLKMQELPILIHNGMNVITITEVDNIAADEWPRTPAENLYSSLQYSLFQPPRQFIV